MKIILKQKIKKYNIPIVSINYISRGKELINFNNLKEDRGTYCTVALAVASKTSSYIQIRYKCREKQKSNKKEIKTNKKQGREYL